ncbi:MAG: CHRD domain-containing protein [Actinomycetota bacterium]|nr:CHRD domain-containing protein [Actinomycetota bacterium]
MAECTVSADPRLGRTGARRPFGLDGGDLDTISQCRFVDPVVLRELRTDPLAYYVQVHNPDYPEGAVRGQLGD